MASGFEVSPTPSDPGNNRMAYRARTTFFWALGVFVVFWLIPFALTFVPSYEAQTIGIGIAWLGLIPVATLSILAIVFGGIGLSRAGGLGGEGQRPALTGLIGGCVLLVLPPILALATTALGIAMTRS